jgi:hypothetical protein
LEHTCKGAGHQRIHRDIVSQTRLCRPNLVGFTTPESSARLATDELVPALARQPARHRRHQGRDSGAAP